MVWLPILRYCTQLRAALASRGFVGATDHAAAFTTAAVYRINAMRGKDSRPAAGA